MVAEIRALLDAYGSIDVRGGVRARASPEPRSTPSRRPSRRPRPGPDRDFVRALVPYMLDRRV